MKILFSTESSDWLSSFLSGPTFGVIVGFLFSTITLLLTNYLRRRSENRKSNETNYVELAKYIEIRTQKMISKAIDDTWADFHLRLFDIANSPIEKEQANKHLEKSNILSQEILTLNGELIKLKTDLELRSIDNSDEFTELFNKLYLFGPRHGHDFPNMNREQMLALADNLHLEIRSSINDVLKPQLLEMTTELLDFVKVKIK